MSGKTALSAHVPPLDLSREMDGVPVLKEAFRDSYAVYHRIAPDPANDFPSERDGDCIECGCFAAPLCGEMLAWLKLDEDDHVLCAGGILRPGVAMVQPHELHDPAALARACLAAAKAGK